ncbi:MAG: efflux RND transporter periplasmic adaptor subunit [Gammaproteobacteria bacterium]|nr:efflux RND transporter periplasmic adaptor subunit [Gammaproteobacteria bacterium]MDP2142481.1 efflux RND transporter periplasmic adaptor subunit [Gammaproteobacteria bacterium]MDP2346461.1 efflux RND transporter periplasmic adaptor subunit [Gammaproteobacteria bacterium]
MYPTKFSIGALLLSLFLTGCGGAEEPTAVDAAQEAALADERGPNNGRLLRDGDFMLELTIFETGVPPEYRAWATVNGNPVAPTDVNLNVQLTRLGGIVDDIGFAPQGDVLRGDMVIYEPHSFSVNITATHAGTTHRWAYDSFEGRTMIEPGVREALGIATEIAGPAIIKESIPVYGRITANSEAISHVSARFDGRIDSVSASIGDHVTAGDRLAQVESNLSLTAFNVTAPISGVITERHAGSGEQTAGRELFTITDLSTVWADLAVFPSDLARVGVGSTVRISTALTEQPLEGTIAMLLPTVASNQAATARVVLDNPDGRLLPGTWVSAQIKVAEYEVPLAVRREGLQSFRDFTVVYAQIGDEFEVRMLEMGRQSDEWVEILGGLAPGTRYVTQNSYILKADVEKDGASHDH